MRIENLTTLVNGELKNNPKISMINGFCLDPNLIKVGMAYLALNATIDDALLAIKSGAYAIITDLSLNSKDDEIAIIRVDSVVMAMIRLMRFFSAQKELKFIHLTRLEGSILECLYLPRSLCLLSCELSQAFMQIMEADDNAYIMSYDEVMIDKLSFSYSSLNDDSLSDLHYSLIESGSLFYTTILFKDNYYSELKFPNIFIKDLVNIMSFFDKCGVGFRINSFDKFSHFRAIFVDRFFNIQEFGQSHRAIICESDEELFKIEASSLRAKFSDAIICAKAGSSVAFMADFIYSDIGDIKKLDEFRYALILEDYQDVEMALNQGLVEPTLF
ncbi:hypothetical protein V2I29_01975 [Campylobacter sp. CX2-8023-23]|uniref:hypothetical protein n=1 Tax=Campylobacter porcelli TaxID=1660073 RepID=UPI002E9DE96D|nr:hypothetical protein [Campylobacter sp. CX2-8023-23]MEE3776258.1 hypothetical protein [Campylobacter sp. CX2-4080-23]